jgi:RNA polymerase sigma factor (sigma-70 family)
MRIVGRFPTTSEAAILSPVNATGTVIELLEAHSRDGGVPDAPAGVGPMVQRSPTAPGLADADGQALFGFVRRLGLSDAQADDAVQETFARLLAEYRRGIVIANPRAWAFRAIYRLAMDEYRLVRRVRLLAERLIDHGGEAARSDMTDRIAVWTEVGRLPERQRQVIYLRYRADLAYEEIGQTLGITSSAARSHATQALERLRTALDTGIEEMS